MWYYSYEWAYFIDWEMPIFSEVHVFGVTALFVFVVMSIIIHQSIGLRSHTGIIISIRSIFMFDVAVSRENLSNHEHPFAERRNTCWNGRVRKNTYDGLNDNRVILSWLPHYSAIYLHFSCWEFFLNMLLEEYWMCRLGVVCSHLFQATRRQWLSKLFQ